MAATCITFMSFTSTHPRYRIKDAQKPLLQQLVKTDSRAAQVFEGIRQRVDAYVHEPSDYLSSRLYMYWNTHATQVYIQGESFSHAGGERAQVPTVMFSGQRGAPTGYGRPGINRRIPHADDTKGVLMHNRTLPGAPLEWVHPSKVGTQIESGNIDIMNIARDAAFLWWLTGDERYGRMAASVIDTYLKGIYHRDFPIDLNHGHQQTLVGMTSFEVIHENIVPPLVECYDLIHDYLKQEYPQHIAIYESALKKIADGIIKGGVPHNNWNIIQARFIFDIAMVLDGDTAYSDRKGHEHYLDVVVNDSTLRQWGLATLARYGFDENTGMWSECAGYSTNVVNDYTDFALLLQEHAQLDLTKSIPVIPKAVAATPQYCFPSRKIVGFGDTHPGALRTSYFGSMIKHAQHSGNRKQEQQFTAMLKCFDPQAAAAHHTPRTDAHYLNLLPGEALHLDSTVKAGSIEQYVSPTFHAPQVSWLVQRNGMNEKQSLMYSLVGSLGNHQHAGGLAMELYGCGVTMAPDAGIGARLYSGLDYAEYYSQFPAHNTVCVDGVSSYPVMKSNHAFKLLAAYPAPSTAQACNLLSPGYQRGVMYSETAFLEPETHARQSRLLSIINAGDAGYYIDIFRSRKTEGGDKMHDYFYHNLGQHMQLMDAQGHPLPTQPTQELSFAGAHLYAYSYIYDQQVAQGEGNVKVRFTITPTRTDEWKEPLYMTMWQKGEKGRKVYQALAPETEGLSRDASAPYSIKGSPTLTFIARQQGEAWQHPFVSVFEPGSGNEGGIIEQVEYFTPQVKEAHHIPRLNAVGIAVQLKHDSIDYIMSSTHVEATLTHHPATCGKLKARARYTWLRTTPDGHVTRLFVGDGYSITTPQVAIESKEQGHYTLFQCPTTEAWLYTASSPCKVRVGKRWHKLKASAAPSPVK